MDAVLASEFDALVHRASAHASLRRALNCAMNGGRFVDERIGAWLLSIRSSAWTPFNFTPREREIADMLVRDCATKEIASSLCVSRHTVKFHVANVYTKAGVHSRSQLKALKGAAHPLQVSES